MRRSKGILTVSAMFIGVMAMVCGMLAPAVHAKAFYAGKTIRIVTFAGPGGGFDISARLIARHIGNHIPGNPRVLVQNMPGGGSLVAANYVYRVAADNPLVIVAPHPDVYIAQLVGEPGVEYDVSQFNWIGSAESDPQLFVMRADTPYTTIAAVQQAAPKEIPLAMTGPGSGTYVFSRLYEHILNVEFRRLIYANVGGTTLAVERREAYGIATGLASLLATRRHWLDEGFVKIILQSGDRRHKMFPDIPTTYEVADRRHHDIIRLLEASRAWFRPYGMGPKVNPEQVQILRDAFMQMLGSREYMEDAHRIGFNVDPMSGAVLQREMREALKQSARTIELLKSFLRE